MCHSSSKMGEHGTLVEGHKPLVPEAPRLREGRKLELPSGLES
jgi:hypothetical protein